MGQFISFLGATYFVACIFLVPIWISTTWNLIFANGNKSASMRTFFTVTIVIAAGLVALVIVNKARRARIDLRIAAARPSSFEAALQIYGPHGNEYVGVSTKTDSLLVVDMKRGVAVCEPMSFLQSWEIEQEGSRAILTVSFNSLDFSSIRIVIPAAAISDLAAKLHYVTETT